MHSGSRNSVEARNKKLGAKYGEALSQSMQHMKNTEIVDLRGNNLGYQGGSSILKCLASGLVYLNLSKNNIGSKAMTHLASWFK
jgi:Ran GTPase-activating protein (RanGAP) involved in mRNA processing and transport